MSSELWLPIVNFEGIYEGRAMSKSPLNLKLDAWTVLMQHERSRQREELVRNAMAQGFMVRTLVTRETLQGQHMDYIIVDEASLWEGESNE